MEILTLIGTSITAIIIVWEFVIKNFWTRIEIKYYGPITDPADRELGSLVPIIVRNKGFRKIKVTKIFLTHSTKVGGLYYSDHDFPYEIEPGNIKVFFVEPYEEGAAHVYKNKYDYVVVKIDHRKKEYIAKKIIISDHDKLLDLEISMSAEYTLYKKRKLILNPPKSQ